MVLCKCGTHWRYGVLCSQRHLARTEPSPSVLLAALHSLSRRPDASAASRRSRSGLSEKMSLKRSGLDAYGG